MADDHHQSGSSSSSPGHHADDEIEEGEFVAPAENVDGTGSETDTDDEDTRYYLQPYRRRPCVVVVDRPVVKRRRLEESVVPGVQRREALPAYRSPPASSSPGSEGTISDGNVGAGGAQAVVLHACPACSREFRSEKAVHGHMRVHAPGKERPAVAVSGGSVKEEVGESMAIVVAEPRRLSMPVASKEIVHGGGGSSEEPSHGAASMAIVVAAAAPNNPSNQLVVVPPPPAAPAPEQVAVQVQPLAYAPQQDFVHPAAAALPQQAVGVQPPNSAPQQAVVHPPPAATPQVAVVQPPGAAQQHIIVHHDPAAPPAGENGGGFSCKECNRWFPTHQGLGGHVAGHKNRRLMREAAAAAAAAAASGVVGDAAAVACRGAAKPKKVHVCSKCGQEYPTGVSLGGHMRKHYSGAPIVQKKRRFPPPPAAAVVEAPAGTEVVLTLAVQESQAPPPLEPPAIEATQPALALAALEPAETASAPPAVEVAPRPAQAPVAGSVRLFGVTIVQPQED